MSIASTATETAVVTHATVRMLGPLEITIDGKPLEPLPGRLASNIFRYLLTRANHRCPRDVLIEEFWPGADPCVARNRLQVAVSSLRRVIRRVTDQEVIEYCGEAYRISDRLELELDVDRFRNLVLHGRRAAAVGDRLTAIRLHEDAIRLYRDDLAPDAVYDDWALLPRERLRIEFVDALDRLCGWLLSEWDLDRLLPVAQRVVEVDPSREDAHRLLMRVYGSQGRVHQVVRQYEFCVRAMRAVLDSDPSPETQEMYRRLRAEMR